MNSKGLALDFVVKAIIVLIVMALVILVFYNLFGSGVNLVKNDTINYGMRGDADSDDVANMFDKCCCTDVFTGVLGVEVDSRGCAEGTAEEDLPYACSLREKNKGDCPVKNENVEENKE